MPLVVGHLCERATKCQGELSAAAPDPADAASRIPISSETRTNDDIPPNVERRDPRGQVLTECGHFDLGDMIPVRKPGSDRYTRSLWRTQSVTSRATSVTRKIWPVSASSTAAACAADRGREIAEPESRQRDEAVVHEPDCECGPSCAKNDLSRSSSTAR